MMGYYKLFHFYLLSALRTTQGSFSGMEAVVLAMISVMIRASAAGRDIDLHIHINLHSTSSNIDRYHVGSRLRFIQHTRFLPRNHERPDDQNYRS